MPATTNGTGAPACPKCGGAMYDNRPGKMNPKAPDFRCKNRVCDAVIWPSRRAGAIPVTVEPAPAPRASDDATAKLAELHARCVRFVLANELPAIEALGGDVAGAVMAAAATVFIAATRGGAAS